MLFCDIIKTVENPLADYIVACNAAGARVLAGTGVVLFMRKDMYEKKNAEANDTGAMFSEQIDKTVTAEFNSWFNELYMVGTLLSDYSSFSGNETEIDEILNGMRSNLPFENVGILLESGDLYFTSDKIFNIAYENLARRLILEEQSAVDIMDLSGEERIIFGIPVGENPRKNIGRIAAICGVSNVDSIDNLLTINAFNRKAVVAIIKNDGFRVAVGENDTMDTSREYANFFTMAKEQLSEEEFTRFESDFLGGNSGTMQMRYPSDNYFVYYSPLHIGSEDMQAAERWHLVIYVPESSIFSYVNQLFRTIFLVMLGILSVAGVTAALLVLLYLRKRNNDLVLKRRLMEIEMLEVTAQQAKDASAAKTVFFSNMSHDIRTPLNGIIGMSAIMKNHVNDPEVIADCVKKIDGASEHLLSLINNVLDMSRIESKKVEIVHDVLNIDMLAEECCSIIYGQLQNRKIDFQFKKSQYAHPHVLGDNLHLKRVLINLLGHAVKFTPDGGTIEFSIREKSATGNVCIYEFEVHLGISNPNYFCRPKVRIA